MGRYKPGLFILAALSVFAIFNAQAQENYADIRIRLDDSGTSYVSGNSNNELFMVAKSEYFTSKKGPYWLFNLSSKEQFSDYYIEIEFPKGAEINYMKAAGSLRITERQSLTLIASGEKGPVEIEVQYIIAKEDKIIWQPYLLMLMAALLVFAIFYRHAISGLLTRPGKKISASRLEMISHTFTDAQKKIISVVKEAGKPITQKQIQHRSALPKATLSRNINLLCMKKILKKESRGMTNVISIDDNFLV